MKKKFAVVVLFLILVLANRNALADEIYEVGDGKTYSNIQAAIDAIGMDHGTDPFGEEVRVVLFPSTAVDIENGFDAFEITNGIQPQVDSPLIIESDVSLERATIYSVDKDEPQIILIDNVDHVKISGVVIETYLIYWPTCISIDGVSIKNSDHIILSEIAITGNSSTGIHVIYSDDFTLERSFFSIGDLSIRYSTNVNVIRNHFYAGRGSNGQVNLYGNQNFIFANNLIQGAETGLSVRSSSTTGTTGRVVNNTLAYIKHEAIKSQSFSTRGVIIENNILRSSDYGDSHLKIALKVDSILGLTTDTNIYFGFEHLARVDGQEYDLPSWRSVFGMGANSLVTDPQFVQAGSGAEYFKLSETSPAIRAAKTQYGSEALIDFFGNSHTRNWDIGFSEYSTGFDYCELDYLAFYGAHEPTAPREDYISEYIDEDPHKRLVYSDPFDPVIPAIGDPIEGERWLGSDFSAHRYLLAPPGVWPGDQSGVVSLIYRHQPTQFGLGQNILEASNSTHSRWFAIRTLADNWHQIGVGYASSSNTTAMVQTDSDPSFITGTAGDCYFIRIRWSDSAMANGFEGVELAVTNLQTEEQRVYASSDLLALGAVDSILIGRGSIAGPGQEFPVAGALDALSFSCDPHWDATMELHQPENPGATQIPIPMPPLYDMPQDDGDFAGWVAADTQYLWLNGYWSCTTTLPPLPRANFPHYVELEPGLYRLRPAADSCWSYGGGNSANAFVWGMLYEEETFHPRLLQYDVGVGTYGSAGQTCSEIQGVGKTSQIIEVLEPTKLYFAIYDVACTDNLGEMYLAIELLECGNCGSAVICETFDQLSGTALNAVAGWTVHDQYVFGNATEEIQSGELVLSTPGPGSGGWTAGLNTNIEEQDVMVHARVSAVGGQKRAILIARATGNFGRQNVVCDSCYWFQVFPGAGSNELLIRRGNGDGFIELENAPTIHKSLADVPGFDPGDFTMSLETIGASIRGYINGVVVYEAVDSVISGPGHIGVQTVWSDIRIKEIGINPDSTCLSTQSND